MTAPKLHSSHEAVVHSSANRTRLRVPKSSRKHAQLHHAQHALEKIQGVSSVEINHQTGSLLVHHDDRPDILNEISSALQESAPEILAALLIPGAEEAEIGMGVITSLFKKCVLGPLTGKKADEPAGNGGSPAPSQPFGVSFPADNTTIKTMLPIAFICAGAWKLMQEEALLAGLAPIACFYYGFDMYWKLRQENVDARIEATADRLAAKQMEKQAHKTTAEHA
jgi:copper chaperone CopZ